MSKIKANHNKILAHMIHRHLIMLQVIEDLQNELDRAIPDKYQPVINSLKIHPLEVVLFNLLHKKLHMILDATLREDKTIGYRDVMEGQSNAIDDKFHIDVNNTYPLHDKDSKAKNLDMLSIITHSGNNHIEVTRDFVEVRLEYFDRHDRLTKDGAASNLAQMYDYMSLIGDSESLKELLDELVGSLEYDINKVIKVIKKKEESLLNKVETELNLTEELI